MNKKQLICYIIISVLGFGCSSTTNNITAPPDEDNDDSDSQEVTTTELYKDQDFQEGLKVTPLKPETVREGGGFDKTYVDTLDFGNDGFQPVWQLTQWHSKYSLEDIAYEEDPSGSKVYSNPGKSVALYPDNSLLLEVVASNEYDEPKEDDDPWPHLYVTQYFDDIRILGSDVEVLNFSMDLKLVYQENKMPEGTFDPSRYTAHTPMYFILQNKNKNSPDYNTRFGFGIRSYDFRYENLSNRERIFWDKGTGKYIYQVAPVEVWGYTNLHDGQWHTAEADLKPLMLQALKAIRKETGAFKSTSPEDLVLTRMNFGWEVSGIFDVAVRVKDFSLKTKIKKDK